MDGPGIYLLIGLVCAKEGYSLGEISREDYLDILQTYSNAAVKNAKALKAEREASFEDLFDWMKEYEKAAKNEN